MYFRPSINDCICAAVSPACVIVTVAVAGLPATATAQVKSLVEEIVVVSELPFVKSHSPPFTTKYSVVSATFVIVTTRDVNV